MEGLCKRVAEILFNQCTEGCVQDCCSVNAMLVMVQVIVLEKGGFTPAAELALTEQEAFSNMYEMGSLLTTQDAGACRCLRALCSAWLMLRPIVTLAWSALFGASKHQKAK